MNEITIRIAEKLPTLTGDVTRIVTDNTDYTLSTEYDSDWTDGLKTYFAVLSDGAVLEPIVGENEITLPRLPAGSSGWLYVGVQQGNMITTRPCAIPVLPSIMAELPDPPIPPPQPDVYAQIIALINQLPAALHAAENAEASANAAAQEAETASAAADAAQDSASAASASAAASAGSASDASESAVSAGSYAGQAALAAGSAGSAASAAAASATAAHAEAASASASASEASASAASAAASADHAEQIAVRNGFAFFDIEEDGHVWLTRTDNLDGELDFEIVAGRLEAIFG